MELNLSVHGMPAGSGNTQNRRRQRHPGDGYISVKIEMEKLRVKVLLMTQIGCTLPLRRQTRQPVVLLVRVIGAALAREDSIVEQGTFGMEGRRGNAWDFYA